MTRAIWWIRRDMRLTDNKALQSAAARGEVVPLFVVDPRFDSAGSARRVFMHEALNSLDRGTGGHLVVRHGNPVDEIASVAKETGAGSVHVASDFAPYGRQRDLLVSARMNEMGVEFVHADSPYVVDPGTVLKDDGTPLKVFTPFFKRWRLLPMSGSTDGSVVYADAAHLTQGLPGLEGIDASLPGAGESHAWDRWNDWAPQRLATYKEDRNDPGKDGTSRLSPYLRFGIVHPRQLIAQLDGTPGADHFLSELAWREFYADVMFHQPETMWVNLQRKMDALPVDSGPKAEARFEIFCSGNTGYPIVDAGVREMLATGIMHNRVRMIVASFLVKDLHLPWQWGARFFMRHLVDGDIASNNHGWQWTAGTGTDAAPYFRVFNPTSQSEKFDPSGTYLRRWVPEIADLDDTHIHAPWTLGLLAPPGYAEPMVDHSHERLEALARYKAVSGK